MTDTSSTKILTVLIPVYNGEKYLNNLLGQFRDFIANHPFGPAFVGRAEILIVDNVSTDGTGRVASSYLRSIPNLRIWSPKEHKPTAEQNVFRSFSQCRGTYTWTLGVDDLPVFSSLEEIFGILEEGKSHLLVFNSPVVSEKMQIIHWGMFKMRGRCYDSEVVSLTQRFGYWFILAGMSGQILKTENLIGYDFDGLIEKTSLIYSHVTAYLDIFDGKVTTLVNLPLVRYKVTHCDVSHWERAGEKLGVWDEYFWTLGFVRQLEYLEKKGVLPFGYIKTALDTNEFFFFRPIHVVIDKIVLQLEKMEVLNCAESQGTESQSTRNRIPPMDFQRVMRHLEERDPMARECVWALESIYAELVKGNKIGAGEWLVVEDLIDHHRSNFILAPNFQHLVGEYEVYFVGGFYCAVHPEYRQLLVDRLQWIDVEAEPPLLFVARDRRTVEREVEKAIEAGRIDHSKFVDLENIRTDKLLASSASAHKVEQVALIGAENERLNRQLKEILSSESWKLTGPMRSAITAIRRSLRFGASEPDDDQSR